MVSSSSSSSDPASDDDTDVSVDSSIDSVMVGELAITRVPFVAVSSGAMGAYSWRGVSRSGPELASLELFVLALSKTGEEEATMPGRSIRIGTAVSDFLLLCT
jgi:hypothetical protein